MHISSPHYMISVLLAFCFTQEALAQSDSLFYGPNLIWEEVQIPADRINGIYAAPNGMVGVNHGALISAVDENFDQWSNIGSVGAHIIDKGHTYTLKTIKSFQPQSSSIIQYSHIGEVIDPYGNILESHSLQPNAFTNSSNAPTFRYYENGLRAYGYNWNEDHTLYYANNSFFNTHDFQLRYGLQDSMGVYQGKVEDHHIWYKHENLNFHASLVSQVDFDFDFQGEWLFEFVSGNLHAFNNETKQILRYEAVNMVWVLLNYPIIFQSNIIENGGLLYARNDSFTFVLNHENDIFTQGDIVGSNQVLNNAIAWNAEVIFNEEACGEFFVSTDQGNSFSPYRTDSFKSIISNVQKFQGNYYLDHYTQYQYGNSNCELSSFCIEEASFNSPNEIIFKSTINNTYKNSDVVVTHFDNTIYLSTDHGTTFDSVGFAYLSIPENRKIVFGLDSLILILGNDVYGSKNLGQSWVNLNMEFNDLSVQDNKLLGLTDDGLFWIKNDLTFELTSEEGGKYLAGKDSTLLIVKNSGHSLKSIDLGQTWISVLQLFKSNIRFLKTDQFILSYGYTDDYTTRVVISENLGDSWKMLINPTPFGTNVGILWLSQIAIADSGAPINGWAVPGDGYLYAMGREKGLWKTNIDNLFRNTGEANLSATICEGEHYELEGVFYEQPGEYIINTINAGGCDSSYIFNLNVQSNYFNQASISLEYGDTIFNQVFYADTVITFQDTSSVGCDSTHQYTINVLTSSAHPQTFEAEFLQIYPTIFEDFITIESRNEIERINVIDLNGILVYEFNPNDKRNIYQLNLREISPGLYFLNIKQKNGIIRTNKIIKGN